jgi:hypothetical protein
MPKALSPLPRERDFEGFSGSPRPLGEGLGVRAKTTVLNMGLVYFQKIKHLKLAIVRDA